MRFAIMNVGNVPVGSRFPAWQAACVRKIVDAGGIPSMLINVHCERDPRVPTTGLPHDTPWDMYSAIARRRVQALQSVSLASQLHDISTLEYSIVRQPNGTTGLPEAAVERVTASQLDFIIQFGSGELQGGILHAAKWGVWFFEYGASASEVVAFWEIYDGAACTAVSLIRRLNGEGASVLCEAVLNTNPAYPRNLNQILMAAAALPARVCKELSLGGEFVERPACHRTASRGRPGVGEMLACFVTSTLWKLRVHALRLYAHCWVIGTSEAPIEDMIRAQAPVGVRWVPAPGTGFVADPFLVEASDGRVSLLAEEFVESDGKGVIVEITLDRAGRLVERRAAISEGHHLSYPFVFEWEGTKYCVPEAANTNSIVLYRFDVNATAWIAYGPIVKGVSALDPTLFHHSGKWWLFCSDWTIGEGHDSLLIFFSKSLLGEWQPHPLNPVKRDVRSSRPAGPLFRVGDEIFRPSQDCSRNYGGGITINRITRLDDKRFAEEAVGHIGPDRASTYRSGIHTIGSAGGVTVVDGLCFRFAPLTKLGLRWKEESRKYRHQTD
jgi:hypothetical protein